MNIVRAVAAIIAIVCVGIFAAACGNDESVPPPPPPAATSTPRTPPPKTMPTVDLSHVDVHNPDAVATAWAAAAYSWLPGSDYDRTDAMLRSRALSDEKLNAGLDQYNPAIGPDSQWRSWVKRQAWVTASTAISPQETPPDSATQALRFVHVVQTVHTPTRPSADTMTTDLAVAMTMTPDGWRVARIKPL